MTKVLRTFVSSLKMIKEDKILLLLSLIPILIGALVYVGLGAWLYTSFIPAGTTWIQGLISLDWLGSFFSWVIKGLFFIIFGGLANYTFVLVVSLLASPFNDMIAERVMLKKKGEVLSLESSFKETIQRLPKTFVNEAKKISLIISLSIFSLLLSFVPFLVILSFIIQVILLSVTFLDYYWSRKNLTLKECVFDYRKNFFFNFMIGLIFFGLLLIPGGGILFFSVLLIQSGLSEG